MIESRFLFYPQRRLDESRRFFFRSREEEEEEEDDDDDDDPDDDDEDPDDDDDDPDDDVDPDVLELSLPLSLPDELELDELDELGDLRLFFFFPNAALNRRSIASPSGTSSPRNCSLANFCFNLGSLNRALALARRTYVSPRSHAHS